MPDERDPIILAAITDAERFYADRLQAMSHASYDLQANAPSAAAIRWAWRELEDRANERNEAETFNDP